MQTNLEGVTVPQAALSGAQLRRHGALLPAILRAASARQCPLDHSNSVRSVRPGVPTLPKQSLAIGCGTRATDRAHDLFHRRPRHGSRAEGSQRLISVVVTRCRGRLVAPSARRIWQRHTVCGTAPDDRGSRSRGCYPSPKSAPRCSNCTTYPTTGNGFSLGGADWAGPVRMGG